MVVPWKTQKATATRAFQAVQQGLNPKTQLAPNAISHVIPPRDSLPEGSHVGVVVSAGRMQRTVKVRTTKQKFNSYLKRHYAEYPTFMVSDPADSLREGDVVRIAPWKKAPKVSHIVTKLMVPFGDPTEERPAVMGLEELVRRRQEREEARWERRVARKNEYIAAKEEQEGSEQQVLSETSSDFTGNKIDELREQALENEIEAGKVAGEAAGKECIDLNKKLEEGVRL